jgi:hypothetical protein
VLPHRERLIHSPVQCAEQIALFGLPRWWKPERPGRRSQFLAVQRHVRMMPEVPPTLVGTLNMLIL